MKNPGTIRIAPDPKPRQSPPPKPAPKNEPSPPNNAVNETDGSETGGLVVMGDFG